MRSEVVRELSRVRSPLDRLRRATTAAAAAGIGAVALAATSVAGLATTSVGQLEGVPVPDASAGGDLAVVDGADLAPYVAEAGLRPGVVLALLLLVMPFLALARQAVRVGSLQLDRRAGLLVVAGAGAGDLRRVAARRGAEAFALGGLAAGPVHVVGWVLLGLLPPVGQRLLPVPQWWLLLVWPVLVVGLAAVGAGLGRRGAAVAVDPVGFSRAPAVPAPTAAVVAAGAGVLVTGVLFGRVLTGPRIGSGEADWATPAVLLLLLGSVALLTTTLVSRRTARRPGPRRRPPRVRAGAHGDAAVAVLAAAQRRGDPTAAGTVAAVVLLAGAAVGIATALAAETQGESFYVTGSVLAGTVAAGGALVGLAALALATTDRLLGAGRSVAATAALGADVRRLVAVQERALSTTAVPAVVLGTSLGGLGWGVASVAAGAAPASAVLDVLVATVLAGLVVRLACGVLARALTGRVRAAAALENLRTP